LEKKISKKPDFWGTFCKKWSFISFALLTFFAFFLNVRHKSKKSAARGATHAFSKTTRGVGKQKKARRRARGGASVTCLALKATRTENGFSRTTTAWHEKRGTKERNARIQFVESKQSGRGR
jgi:hypothetical protein